MVSRQGWPGICVLSEKGLMEFSCWTDRKNLLTQGSSFSKWNNWVLGKSKSCSRSPCYLAAKPESAPRLLWLLGQALWEHPVSPLRQAQGWNAGPLSRRRVSDERRKRLDPANSCSSGWKETWVLVKQGISVSKRMPTRFFLPNQTRERTRRSPKFISRHKPPKEQHWVPVSLLGRAFLEDDSYSTSYLAPSRQLVQT